MSENNKDWTAKQSVQVVVGLFIAAGAVVAWHFFKIDGFLAFIAGGFGLAIIGKAFGEEFNWFEW